MNSQHQAPVGLPGKDQEPTEQKVRRASGLVWTALKISPSLGLDSRSVQPAAYSLYICRLRHMTFRLHIEWLQAEPLCNARTKKKSTRNKHTAVPPAQLTSLIRILYSEKPEWPCLIHHTFLAYFYRTPDLFEEVL